MPGRNAQVTRIYVILGLLDGVRHGLTVAEITEKVNDRGHPASRRTIYRDLEALEAAGFPLHAEGDKGENNENRWVLEKVTKVTEHFVLTARELLALYFAQGVLSPLKGTPFFSDLTSIFTKIEDRLGSRGNSHLGELREGLHFEPGPRWGLGIDPDLLETVRACCAEKQVLKVQYHSASKQEKRERHLGPHYLYYAKGSLYLVAEDLEENKVKLFSVPRMSEAKMDDAIYEGTPSDPTQFFEGTFGVYRGGDPIAAKIEIAPVIAAYVKERQWHESQSIVSKSDGSVVLSIEASLTPEFIHWILGFGPNAKVISPPELSQKVSEAAKKTAELYKTKKAA